MSRAINNPIRTLRAGWGYWDLSQYPRGGCFRRLTEDTSLAVDTFHAGELRISRRVDAYGEEGAPKSTAGIRTVPLSAQLVSALKAWKLRSPFSKSVDLIFSNRQGGHIGHDNLIKRRFLPLFAGAKAFNWHGLRHFAISTWIEAGLAPKTVQTFAGHASLQVTMDRYGHLFPSDDHKKAMDQIAKGLFK
jgi:integrase